VWTLACNLGAEPCALVRPAGAMIFETTDDALANGRLVGHATVALLEASGG